MQCTQTHKDLNDRLKCRACNPGPSSSDLLIDAQQALLVAMGILKAAHKAAGWIIDFNSPKIKQIEKTIDDLTHEIVKQGFRI